MASICNPDLYNMYMYSYNSHTIIVLKFVKNHTEGTFNETCYLPLLYFEYLTLLIYVSHYYSLQNVHCDAAVAIYFSFTKDKLSWKM